MTKKTTPNNFFAVFAVLIIIATSLSLLFLAKTNEDPIGSFIRTVDNASYDCEEEIVSRYGNKLISKSFDNLSSRYQPRDRQYWIYYRISVRESATEYPKIDDYLVKCTIGEHLGEISDFRIID